MGAGHHGNNNSSSSSNHHHQQLSRRRKIRGSLEGMMINHRHTRRCSSSVPHSFRHHHPHHYLLLIISSISLSLSTFLEKLTPSTSSVTQSSSAISTAKKSFAGHKLTTECCLFYFNFSISPLLLNFPPSSATTTTTTKRYPLSQMLSVNSVHHQQQKSFSKPNSLFSHLSFLVFSFLFVIFSAFFISHTHTHTHTPYPTNICNLSRTSVISNSLILIYAMPSPHQTSHFPLLHFHHLLLLPPRK